MAVAARESPASALPASGSSFYAAMRILPRPRREAMYAIYAFCRAVDDIADDGGPRDGRLLALQRWRDDINAIFQGGSPTGAAHLVGPARQYRLEQHDFHAVIDGMAMDVAADIRAPDWETLDLYCDRVASAVGRLSVRVFGLEPVVGDELAYHLGRALQLTNILRDLDEDAAIGRLYLPREALQRAGIEPDGLSPTAVLAQKNLPAACDEVAARALQHLLQSSRVMALCPRSGVRAPRLMKAAYQDILRKLIARGWAAPRTPVKVSKPRLLGAVLRYGLI